MTIETEQELRELRQIGRIVAQTLQAMIDRTEPGMTTGELDLIGKEWLEHYEARSAPKVTYDFPGYTCISVNEEVAHGIPGSRVIQPGDVVNIDVSAEKSGYFADTGASFVVPPVNAVKNRLIDATQQALQEACHRASAGRSLNVIGSAIQQVARQSGFQVIRNLCSHGIGHGLHEEPSEIPGYYLPGEKRRLHEGLVITIEPFLSTTNRFVTETDDGWTLAGGKRSLSAQFEHTLVITRGKPILLTLV